MQVGWCDVSVVLQQRNRTISDEEVADIVF
jgi:hypothetical protein